MVGVLVVLVEGRDIEPRVVELDPVARLLQ